MPAAMNCISDNPPTHLNNRWTLLKTEQAISPEAVAVGLVPMTKVEEDRNWKNPIYKVMILESSFPIPSSIVPRLW